MTDAGQNTNKGNNDEGVSAGTDTDTAAETTNADETLGDIAEDSDADERA